MDIEGSEFAVVPQVMMTGSLCRTVDYISVEWHARFAPIRFHPNHCSISIFGRMRKRRRWHPCSKRRWQTAGMPAAVSLTWSRWTTKPISTMGNRSRCRTHSEHRGGTGQEAEDQSGGGHIRESERDRKGRSQVCTCTRDKKGRTCTRYFYGKRKFVKHGLHMVL